MVNETDKILKNIEIELGALFLLIIILNIDKVIKIVNDVIGFFVK